MSGLDRRRFLFGVGGLLVSPLGLVGCGSPQHPLNVALHPWLGYELLHLAETEGWVDSAEIELISTHSATESLALLSSGEAESACLTLDEVLRARAEGLPLKVVLVMDESAGADALYVKPEIKALRDLRGMRIGVEDSAVGWVLLSKVLEEAGLQTSDIRMVSLSVNQQPHAWREGQLDAAITYEPIATQLSALGASRLFDTRSAPDLIIDVLAVHADRLHDHRHGTQLKALLAAHFKALKRLTLNPQDAAYRMASGLSLTGEEVLHAFRGLVLPDEHENRRFLKADGPLLVAARRLNSILVAQGKLTRPDALTDLVTADYLP